MDENTNQEEAGLTDGEATGVMTRDDEKLYEERYGDPELSADISAIHNWSSKNKHSKYASDVKEAFDRIVVGKHVVQKLLNKKQSINDVFKQAIETALNGSGGYGDVVLLVDKFKPDFAEVDTQIQIVKDTTQHVQTKLSQLYNDTEEYNESVDAAVKKICL